MKYKERCRKNVIKSICMCNFNNDADFAAREVKYFEDLYDSLKVKDYIVKMGNIELSYFYREDLSRYERAIFVEGMEFADVEIGNITANNIVVIPEEVQLEFIKSQMKRKQENGEILLNESDEEIFKSGILTACAVGFNIVDTENIFSKSK